MTAPLEGIKVLDLSRVLAGPYCAQMLGDMGADVLKIEEPEVGDESRTYGPFVEGEAAGYLSMNRNKQAMTLNLKAPEGQEILKKLVAGADVLVENFRTGTMESMGLGYEVLSRVNPRLIYCSITAFGTSGPYKDRAGYEALMQAHTGVMSITGEPQGAPVRCGVSFLDLSTGMMAAFGIMNALYHRQKTSMGQQVDASLLETSISYLSLLAVGYLIGGVVSGRYGSGHPAIVPYQVFEAKDGYIFVAAANQRLWTRMCEALNRRDLLEDPRFATQPDRVKHRNVLVPILQSEIRKYDTEELVGVMDRAGVPSNRVNRIDDVMNDPQTHAREMVIQVPHPKIRDLKLLGIPVKLSQSPGSVRRPPPVTGQHTEEVLKELGYGDTQVKELRQKKVI
ncbi:MAG: CoA transferase [Chloroflexi bacterium]|nr:CoA transferase [Chloroflexota bacterium]